MELGRKTSGTRNNYKSYGHKLGDMDEATRHLLCDAQTSGGLLCVVRTEARDEYLKVTSEAGLDLSPIGETTEQGEKLIYVD